MGYFSWKTADTNQSIRVGAKKKVYLLQPNKVKPIEEKWYEGYGEFGEVDAYEWLAKNNLSAELLEKANKIIEKSIEEFTKTGNCSYELRNIGIYLDSEYYIDIKTKKEYCYDGLMAELFELNKFESYDSVIKDKKTVNQLIEEKEFKKVKFSKLIGGLKYPLKFSFDENAVYEDLKASKICPKQGYF